MFNRGSVGNSLVGVSEQLRHYYRDAGKGAIILELRNDNLTFSSSELKQTLKGIG